MRGCMVKGQYFLVFILMIICSAGIVSAAQPRVDDASMIARGSAVIVKDMTSARQQAITDTLNNALDRYIHEKMVSGHEYDEQINDQMLNHQERYIVSYEIISDRRLGDLLQLELHVHFNKTLLQEDLAGILEPKKRAIQDVCLIVCQQNLNEQWLNEPLLVHSLLLEPEKLATRLHDELAAYGFTLTLQNNIPDRLKELLRASLHQDRASAAHAVVTRAEFRDLAPGDLIIYVDIDHFQKEKISTVHKELLSVKDTVTFIDMKNETSLVLPPATSKFLSSDFLEGMSALSERLLSNVENRVMDHMLQKYAVFPEHEEEVLVRIAGFRRHLDYVYFKKALEKLRTIKSVDLNALSRSQIELKVTTYAQRDLLLNWLNHFTSPVQHYQLRAEQDHSATAAILVKVDYAKAAY